MTKQLNLYFDRDSLTTPTDQLVVDYAVVEKGEVCSVGNSRLADLSALVAASDSMDISVVLPGNQVTSFEIALPQIKRRHLDQALPYLLEEELAAPIETLHIAHGDASADGRLICAAIDKTLLEQYLALLADAGIKPRQMLPDYWTINPVELPQLRHKDSRLLLRLTMAEGLSLPDDTDRETLNKILAEASETFTEETCNTVADWQPGEIAAAPVNLLQGAYAPEKTSTAQYWLKPAAVAMAASLFIFIGYFFVAGWYFNQQADKLADQAETLYKDYFPNDKKIINVRRQMEAHLKSTDSTTADSLFFDLLNAFAAANDNQANSINIRNLRFSQESSSLNIEVQTASINDANSLQNRIAKNGVSAEVLSANSNAEGVLTRLRIQPEGLQ